MKDRNNNLRIKAAMFGLDARIALAIFGSLSIIAGASLYNVIENVKVVTFIESFNQIGKAFEQYYLDTGQYLPRSDANNKDNALFYEFKTYFLQKDPNVKGWKGPYLSYKKDINSNHLLQYPKLKNSSVHIFQLDKNGALGGSNRWDTSLCKSGKTCSIWIMVTRFQDQNFPKMIDKKIDNGDGDNSGKIRWYYMNATERYYLFYEYMPAKNPYN